ncbi:MAG TPA: hypothetical protein VIX73_38995 [Kofleriaceae bacterium]|jgi:hypothetical protein
MKKHKQSTVVNNNSNHSASFAIRRETVRTLNPEGLALVAGGSSTVVTERPNTTHTAC